MKPYPTWLRLTTVALMATALGACRGDSGDDDDDDDDDSGSDGGVGDDVSIHDIQAPSTSFEDGDRVDLGGVVVTAIDGYGGRTGSVWVAEPEEHATHGRAYSGVLVFLRGS